MILGNKKVKGSKLRKKQSLFLIKYKLHINPIYEFLEMNRPITDMFIRYEGRQRHCISVIEK